MNLYASLSISIVALALASCASKVDVVGKFAPNSGLSVEQTPRRIAVFDFNGSDGQANAAELEAILAEAQFEGQPFFKIVDRARSRELMGEFARKVRGEIDPSTAATFGRQLGADGILFGTVAYDLHSEQTTETRYECGATNDKGKCVQNVQRQVSCTKRSATFGVTARLVRVNTAQVVYASPKSGIAATKYCSGESQSKGDAVLLGQARRSAMDQVRRDLAPYEMVMKVKLKDDTDGLEDAAKESFKGAVDFAEAGRMDRACDAWRKLNAQGVKTVALMYNIAVCAETEGRLPHALQAYQDVDRMLSKPDSDVNDALDRVKNQMSQKKKIGSAALGS